MPRLLAVLVGLLLACVGLANAAEALAVVPSVPGPSYTYDTPTYDAPENYAAPERGLPVKGYASTTYNAVDLRSYGPPAVLGGHGPRATYDYDDTALLVQGAMVAATPERPARAHEGAPPAFERTRVAAKTPIGPGWFPHGTNKIPSGWSGPGMTKKFRQDPGKEGFVWRGPKQSSVRIDRGNPSSPYPSQQVDHVVINDGGRVVGRDGQLLPSGTRISDVPDQAHIPLSEWNTWGSWNGH
ncbi:hypothetical protein [Nocardioides limicola]|uniref:hypothetical protein n=1 Tax=Nocardioides limicola TaxID=2803368 RepID=UPI00193B07CA|nr:hypothetical protein [Nocardioides sp. DJM-14]